MEYKKLADVCKELFAGGDVDKNHLSFEASEENNIPIFTNGVENNGLYGFTNKIRVNEVAITISARGTIGYSCLRTVPFYPAVRLIVAVPNTSMIEPKFLLYFINSKKYGGRGASIPQLTVPMIKNEKIPLLRLDYQQEIISILDKINAIIDADKKQLELLDETVKSQFIEMFKDDIKGKTNRLSDLCEVITKGTTPTTIGFDFVEEGVNFVKIECITETYEFLIDKMLHITSECDEKLKRSKLKENDVLFSIAGAIGRTAIVSKDILPANTNQALAIIRLRKDSGLNVKFLNEMLHTELIKEQVDGKKNGVAQTNLSLTDIGNLNVIVPSMEKQLKFESFVNLIDKSKFNIKQHLKLTQELLDKKMDEYFGG